MQARQHSLFTKLISCSVVRSDTCVCLVKCVLWYIEMDREAVHLSLPVCIKLIGHGLFNLVAAEREKNKMKPGTQEKGLHCNKSDLQLSELRLMTGGR